MDGSLASFKAITTKYASNLNRTNFLKHTVATDNAALSTAPTPTNVAVTQSAMPPPAVKSASPPVISSEEPLAEEPRNSPSVPTVSKKRELDEDAPSLTGPQTLPPASRTRSKGKRASPTLQSQGTLCAPILIDDEDPPIVTPPLSQLKPHAGRQRKRPRRCGVSTTTRVNTCQRLLGVEVLASQARHDHEAKTAELHKHLDESRAGEGLLKTQLQTAQAELAQSKKEGAKATLDLHTLSTLLEAAKQNWDEVALSIERACKEISRLRLSNHRLKSQMQASQEEALIDTTVKVYTEHKEGLTSNLDLAEAKDIQSALRDTLTAIARGKLSEPALPIATLEHIRLKFVAKPFPEPSAGAPSSPDLVPQPDS